MSLMRPDQIKALLFDKDGTLFDFRATWEGWAQGTLDDLAGGDADMLSALAAAIGFDLATGSFHNSSLAIAGTNAQIAEALCTVAAGRTPAQMERYLALRAAEAPLAPVTDLPALLDLLRSAGFKLGVMTNDNASTAQAHLAKAGIAERFDFICGADSGHGAKPAPEPLLAFCAHVGIDPNHTAMIGDSTHDLIAAHAAGMTALGVLTGMATAAELAPRADAVLSDIAQLPEWLGLAE